MRTARQVLEEVFPVCPEHQKSYIIMAMKEYAEQECIQFLDDIRSYEHENKVAITDDERSSEMLYQIHLENK